jgi:hypothetical protein
MILRASQLLHCSNIFFLLLLLFFYSGADKSVVNETIDNAEQTILNAAFSPKTLSHVIQNTVTTQKKQRTRKPKTLDTGLLSIDLDADDSRQIAYQDVCTDETRWNEELANMYLLFVCFGHH